MARGTIRPHVITHGMTLPMTHIASILAMPVLLAVAGCAEDVVNFESVPLSAQYRAPAAALAHGAIVGSAGVVSLQASQADVVDVDGKRVMLGDDDENGSLNLPVGLHKLTVACSSSSLTLTKAILDIEVVAGANYQLKFKARTRMNGAPIYCDFWIINTKDGTVASQVARSWVQGVAGS